MSSGRTRYRRGARRPSSAPGAFSVAAVGLALLAGCATPTQSEEPAAQPEPATHDGVTADDVAAPGSDITEIPAPRPRLVISHDGGVSALDANSLELVGTVALDGFARVNPAGDGRHALVSTTGGFRVLDVGTWGEAHGNHAHYYSSAPLLTDVLFPASTPGHVTVHAGRTVLFDDGTGEALAFDSAAVAEGPAAGARFGLTTPSPHHGVAVQLADGTLVVSDGDESGRTGARAHRVDDAHVAASDECPDLHGAAVAAGEVVVLGCADGALVYDEARFTKVDSPDGGGLGTLAGSASSDIVLADYPSTADGAARVALVDTADLSIRVVEMPAAYTFRSFGRGPDGEALVLGTDGALHVIDPGSGEIVATIPVTDPWRAPEDWQEPRPTLLVHDGSAYVTEPGRGALHAVDVETRHVWRRAEIGLAANEIVGVSGAAPEAESDSHHHDDSHDH